MSERCSGSVRCNIEDLQEALSIHTRKITDSCRDKDCIEDLRVYLTKTSQNILDGCASAKVRCAELLYTYIDVEPVAFDGHHYCVNATFFYRILADAVVGCGRPVTLCGVATFSKRAVLCGEESKAHIFTSRTRLGGPDGLSRVSANLPTAVVEVLDPMVLSSKVVEVNCCPREGTVKQIPEAICGCFDEELVLCGEESRAHIFTSNTNLRGPDGFTAPSANLPTAVVEVTDTNLLGGGSVGWSRWDCKAKTDIFTLLQKKDVIV